MAEGWIKLHRQIRGHVFFKQKRIFSRFEAWVDMLLEANHCDKPWIAGNEVISVKRGTFITSEIKLMNRWSWSKSKVRAFLKLLQDEKMIVKKTDSKKTTVSIVNYGLYQSEETTKEPEKNQKRTAKEPQKDTTKNVKNVKNDKKVIKDIYITVQHLPLTKTDYEKLIAEYGQTAVDEKIQYAENYAKLKNYKSIYLTLNNWLKKDAKSNKPVAASNRMVITPEQRERYKQPYQRRADDG